MTNRPMSKEKQEVYIEDEILEEEEKSEEESRESYQNIQLS